ncbi:hypothetical protein WJX84_012191 [Apatococcus fuscideae]|uniref:Katanin p80 WD40 repeat-containing subunit B1 homolog n=1 Tax=Apatococcus fuscideae TaxID=2026836 RepID=A0AAW1RN26_9CHLO
MKRACKLQEFTAHGSAVTCLQLGKKTAGVLVTGGEDKKVNVWALGKPVPQLTLTGHHSAIESVAFDVEEVRVAAGACGGTLKLWDLEANKVMRTLTGHRASCLAVDFHPAGMFLASGSADTNVKVWDLRQRRCINTYQGHPKSVTHLRHSPDGTLLATGGPDGTVWLWNMSAGKLQHELEEHSHAITSLEFHPSQLLLASTSADRTACFWDVQDTQLLAKVGPDATGVHAACFPADGRVLLTATAEGLQSHSWDPVHLHDFLEVPWTKVCQVGYQEATHTLVGCSTSGSFVGIWTVALNRMQPWARDKDYGVPGADRNGGSKSKALRSITGNIRKADASQYGRISPAKPPPAVPSPHVPMNAAARARFRQTPGRAAGRLAMIATPSPDSCQAAVANETQQSHCHATRGSSNAEARMQEGEKSRRNERTRMVPMQKVHGVAWELGGAVPDVPGTCHPSESIAELSGTPAASTPCQADAGASCPSSAPEASSSSAYSITASSSPCDSPDQEEGHSADSRPPGATQAELRRSTERALRAVADDSGPGRGRQKAADAAASRTAAGAHGGRSEQQRPCVASSQRGPQGLKVADFIPASAFRSKATSTSTRVEEEQGMIKALMILHAGVVTALDSRLSNLQTVRGFWLRRDIKGALSALKAAADPSATMDALHAKSSGYSILGSLQLESCAEAAGLLIPLLSSPHSRHLDAGLDALSSLLASFVEVIREACARAPGSMGVDLSFEMRRERCLSLKSALQNLQPQLMSHAQEGAPMRLKALHLLKQLDRL